MGKARGKVAGWVHGVAGGRTERHAEGHDNAGDGEGAEAAHSDGDVSGSGGVALGAERKDQEHQQCRGDELGEEIDALVFDGGHGAEAAEHAVGVVGGCREMVDVEGVDQDGAEEAAQHLGRDVGQDRRPGETSGQGEA